ncbi:LCP family protein [Actinacidiphila glaucinigra]|uniref:Transcriptional attenuator, LytR family n=1 Tax=Actinacidiphila glaucinigra TaxID=235986 RepID=A0A239ALJ1_9ACTN|nr:LCP family protein [Actinacidiphila glaucinigra]WSD61795.1 LCP family protein [Actinacidiphila glaucinigra]SNR96546.1 transcriptional attenuator, LytR family [Actinacidiphila glaucinigra]
MNAWPDGWSDNRNQRQQQVSEPPLPPELSPRRAAAAPGSVPRQQAYGSGVPGHGGPGGGDYDGYGGGSYGPPSTGGRGTPPGSRKRRVKGVLIGLAVVVAAWSIGTYFWADGKVRREVDLGTVIDRPETGEGTNYLIVGSDSREGLSSEQKKKLHTGSAEGKRTDSMMILHVGDNGNSLISLPRDSYVTIPEFKGSESGKTFPSRGQNKLNAAYSIDGPTLLVRTVEYNTGLHIDHYAEIGFAGFAGLVDAVGGVELDIPRNIDDKNSGLHIQKGKQTLNGDEALAFVRQRYQEAEGDLGRTKNQQKFLSALASQTATPGTVLNPFKLYPTMGAGLDTLIVDKDMSLWDLASMFWAMKGVSGGDGVSMNMPTSGSIGTNVGSALKWDMPKVKQLVSELKNDEKVTVTPDS